MAPHDLKNGYTRIANSLMECIYRSDITGFELRALLWVVRNSYGYNRKYARNMTIREMAKEMKISPWAAFRAMRSLTQKGVIKKTEKDELFFNKSALPFVAPVQQPCCTHATPQAVAPMQQSVAPMQQLVAPVQQAECNIKKDNLKDNLKDKGEVRERTARAPLLEEIRAYCLARKSSVNPDQFFDHYEATGWMMGRGVKMVNWRAAVRSWEKNGIDTKPAAKGCAPVPGKYAGKEVRV